MKISELRQIIRESIKELKEENQNISFNWDTFNVEKDITPYKDYIVLRHKSKNKSYLIKSNRFSKAGDSVDVSYEWDSLEPYNSNPSSSTSSINLPNDKKGEILSKHKNPEKPLKKYWGGARPDRVIIGKKEKEEKEKRAAEKEKEKKDNPTSGKIAKGLGKWGKAIANTVGKTDLGPRYKPKA